MRIGHSIDIHAFADDRELKLGGISIPGRGLQGHSDADVVLHAISESILGALALGDLGEHFPDTDDKYKNKDSSFFVSRSIEMMTDMNYIVSNIDCMIVCEEPKLKPYIGLMRKHIANLLLVQENQVSIKATTAEGLGFLGNKKGIMATATVLLEEV